MTYLNWQADMENAHADDTVHKQIASNRHSGVRSANEPWNSSPREGVTEILFVYPLEQKPRNNLVGANSCTCLFTIDIKGAGVIVRRQLGHASITGLRPSQLPEPRPLID